jgi:DNA-binding CsgD family transcriptional regulator
MNTQYLSNETITVSPLYDHIDHLLETTKASIYWKDIRGHYLGANTPFLKNAALPSLLDVVKKTDLDLIWANEAVRWKQNDYEVINTGKAKKYLEPCRVGNRVELFISHKMPLRSKSGKIIGVFGISTLYDEKEVEISDYPTPENAFENIVVLDPKSYQSHIYLTSDLTKRQMECLRYIVKGMTAKEIAKIMFLSPRTIEHYIQAIKLKWNCHSRSKLVEKALDFFSYRKED